LNLSRQMLGVYLISLLFACGGGTSSTVDNRTTENNNNDIQTIEGTPSGTVILSGPDTNIVGTILTPTIYFLNLPSVVFPFNEIVLIGTNNLGDEFSLAIAHSGDEFSSIAMGVFRGGEGTGFGCTKPVTHFINCDNGISIDVDTRTVTLTNVPTLNTDPMVDNVLTLNGTITW